MMCVETPDKGTSIQAPVDNLISQDDDSDDDTVIYTSDPECDQNKKTDIGDIEPTNGKPRLSKQISINLKMLTSEEISSWQSNDLPAIHTQLPSLKRHGDRPQLRDCSKQKQRSIAVVRKSGRNKPKTGQDVWYDDTELEIPPSPKRKKRVLHYRKPCNFVKFRSELFNWFEFG